MKKLFVIAAAMLLAVSCNDYNDSELRGRVDELEGKVDAHEQWLAELDAQIKSMNDANKAFTALLNGGMITGVATKNESGRTGLEFTIAHADGTTEKYVVWNGTNGTNGTDGVDGAAGEDGLDGHSPKITVESDDNGRLYWCLDGQPMTDEKGRYIYATGDTGAKGDRGTTPELKVETDPADGVMSWWVSYDNGQTWKKLSVVAGDVKAVAGIEVEYDEEAGTVRFMQGSESWTFAYNTLGMSFSVDGEAVEAYSQIKMSAGDSIEIEVAVEGASDKAAVKAELQNPGYGFEVFVNGNTITVDAVGAGSNKLLVEVLDGANCYHSWIDVVVAPNAWVEVVGTDDWGYLPVAFAGDRAYGGTDFSNLNKIPAKLTVTVELDSPAYKDMKFNVSLVDIYEGEEEMIPMDAITMPASVTVKKGQSSVAIPFEMDRSKLVCDSFFYIELESDEAASVEGCEVWIANNFVNKADLKAANYECVFDASASGEGQGIPALFDEDPTTMLGTAYWATDEMTTFADQIAVYGVYVDVTLPANVAVVQFKYQNRAGTNGQPRALAIGAYNGTDYDLIGTVTEGFQTENSAWNTFGLFYGKAMFGKVRFGVTSSQTQQLNDLTTNPAGSMTLAELYVNVMY